MNFEKRKRFRNALAGLLLFSVLLSGISGCSRQDPSSQTASGSASSPGYTENQGAYSKTTFALSTVITITVYQEADAAWLNDCEQLIRSYENTLSRTLETSEIARLNSRAGNEVSQETAELISTGLYYSELTGGAYDITVATLTSLWDFLAEEPAVPEEDQIREAIRHIGYQTVHADGTTVTFDDDQTGIELGSIAKGYIADQVKEFLVSKGVESAMINLGGNVLLLGSKTDGTDFRIGIQTPFGSNADYFGIVAASDQSIVTSGVYERCFQQDGKNYHHILNPRTGYPYDNGLLSVTIIGPESTHCDALSTACFSLGLEKGMELIDSIPDYYAIFVSGEYDTDPSGWEYTFSDGFTENVNYTKHN